AANKLRDLAATSTDLRALSALLDDALLADLGQAVEALVAQIQSIAAVASDVTLLMETLPRLARVMRYGSVRETDASMVRGIIDGIVPRITIGLGGAVASLNDDAAQVMLGHIRSAHSALELIASQQHSADWIAAISRIAEQPAVHGLVRGKCVRLLLDG